jgi:hypothetical protein
MRDLLWLAFGAALVLASLGATFVIDRAMRNASRTNGSIER